MEIHNMDTRFLSTPLLYLEMLPYGNFFQSTVVIKTRSPLETVILMSQVTISVGVPTSEMDSVQLPRWAEARQVNTHRS